MPNKTTKGKKPAAKKPASKKHLQDAGVIHPESQTQFLPKPSWTGPGPGAPAAHRFRHWVCNDNNTCTPYVEQESFTENINWRIFRIMAEFVEGFEFLSRLKKEVTIFGSARAMPENKYYKSARALGQRLGKEGYAVITGGGPGIMEAGNRGSFEVDGE